MGRGNQQRTLDKRPSKDDFIHNLSNHNYQNKLVDVPIDVQAILFRVAIVSGVISLPTTSMVDRTRIKALQ
jgi:hypothetical protein